MKIHVLKLPFEFSSDRALVFKNKKTGASVDIPSFINKFVINTYDARITFDHSLIATTQLEYRTGNEYANYVVTEDPTNYPVYKFYEITNVIIDNKNASHFTLKMDTISTYFNDDGTQLKNSLKVVRRHYDRYSIDGMMVTNRANPLFNQSEPITGFKVGYVSRINSATGHDPGTYARMFSLNGNGKL